MCGTSNEAATYTATAAAIGHARRAETVHRSPGRRASGIATSGASTTISLQNAAARSTRAAHALRPATNSHNAASASATAMASWLPEAQRTTTSEL